MKKTIVVAALATLLAATLPGCSSHRAASRQSAEVVAVHDSSLNLVSTRIVGSYDHLRWSHMARWSADSMAVLAINGSDTVLQAKLYGVEARSRDSGSRDSALGEQSRAEVEVAVADSVASLSLSSVDTASTPATVPSRRRAWIAVLVLGVLSVVLLRHRLARR